MNLLFLSILNESKADFHINPMVYESWLLDRLLTSISLFVLYMDKYWSNVVITSSFILFSLWLWTVLHKE